MFFDGIIDCNKIRRIGLSLLAFCVAVMTWGMSISYSESETGKRILFISSYSPSFPTFFLQIDGIKSELDNGRNVIDIEFMDTKRFPDQENKDRFYKNLKYKLTGVEPYDVVIVSDDDGINFVMSKKEELFPNTPIVFMGVNNIEHAKQYSEDPLVTGVVESASIGDTVGLAYALNQKAKRVVALVDSTSSGQADLASYYKASEQFPDLTFTDLDLSDMTFQEFSNHLEELTNQDLVLCLSAYVDKQGTVMNFLDSLELMLEHLHQPLYHPYYHGVGNGMLGGRVISHYEQGKQAGLMVNRIFSGKTPATIPVLYDSPNPYLIDYKVFNEYNLDEGKLPPYTQFVNREENALQRYFGVIVGVILGLILQMMIIITLFRNIGKRKKAEEAIMLKQAELEEANDELTTLNEGVLESNNQLVRANLELTSAFEEITKQKKQINDMLHIDGLTGMNNRLGIMEKLDELLEDTSLKKPFYVLFLDIDNFKNINDTFGHDLGDQIIYETGQRLVQLEREFFAEECPDDEILFQAGRFGGDEFLILVLANCFPMENWLEWILDCLKDRIVINDNQFYLTTSIGIAESPKDGRTKEELIKKADLALYEAKNSGKNKYVVFQQVMSIAVKEKMQFQSLLKTAFLKKEFSLHYQPYICPLTNTIMGFEALIRWEKPEYRGVSPYKIITNAEEIGLIIEIGNWVFEEACKFAKEAAKVSKRPIPISVNISMVQLMYKNFVDDIVAVIKRLNIEPETICLEMTETIMLQSIETGQALIQQLRNIGFSVALDDFGTGYSSLSYLRNLPVNVIKIDRSFICDMENNLTNQYTLEAIVRLAHQLGFRIIAEGVEKQEQIDYLSQYHCDAIQGFFYSPPLSKTAAIQFLEASEYKIS